MKKFLLLAGLLFLLVSNAKADNVGSYFTMGENDTLYINPLLLTLAPAIPVNAHFESRFDSWIVWMHFPSNSKCEGVSRGNGMNIPYVTSNGTDSVFMAEVTFNHDTDTLFSASTTEYGYWDPDSDGVYSSYGLVKWEPGDYDSIFNINLSTKSAFRQGYISIMGHLSATDDLRGGTGDEWFSRSVFVKVGYRLGDANGDGYIDTGDVSLIIKFIMGQESPNEFQFDASDVNEDGVLDTGDVAQLIRWVLGMSSTQDFDIEDYI